jgi:hypothetical protein
MIEGRDSIERLRITSSKVLGRAVRVCAKLEEVAAGDSPATRTSSEAKQLRAKFEQDPMVRSMLERFGGKITEVKRAED